MEFCESEENPFDTSLDLSALSSVSAKSDYGTSGHPRAAAVSSISGFREGKRSPHDYQDMAPTSGSSGVRFRKNDDVTSGPSGAAAASSISGFREGKRSPHDYQDLAPTSGSRGVRFRMYDDVTSGPSGAAAAISNSVSGFRERKSMSNDYVTSTFGDLAAASGSNFNDDVTSAQLCFRDGDEEENDFRRRRRLEAIEKIREKRKNSEFLRSSAFLNSSVVAKLESSSSGYSDSLVEEEEILKPPVDEEPKSRLVTARSSPPVLRKPEIKKHDLGQQRRERKRDKKDITEITEAFRRNTALNCPEYLEDIHKTIPLKDSTEKLSKKDVTDFINILASSKLKPSTKNDILQKNLILLEPNEYIASSILASNCHNLLKAIDLLLNDYLLHSQNLDSYRCLSDGLKFLNSLIEKCNDERIIFYLAKSLAEYSSMDPERDLLETMWTLLLEGKHSFDAEISDKLHQDLINRNGSLLATFSNTFEPKVKAVNAFEELLKFPHNIPKKSALREKFLGYYKHLRILDGTSSKSIGSIWSDKFSDYIIESAEDPKAKHGNNNEEPDYITVNKLYPTGHITYYKSSLDNLRATLSKIDKSIIRFLSSSSPSSSSSIKAGSIVVINTNKFDYCSSTSVPENKYVRCLVLNDELTSLFVMDLGLMAEGHPQNMFFIPDDDRLASKSPLIKFGKLTDVLPTADKYLMTQVGKLLGNLQKVDSFNNELLKLVGIGTSVRESFLRTMISSRTKSIRVMGLRLLYHLPSKLGLITDDWVGTIVEALEPDKDLLKYSFFTIFELLDRIGEKPKLLGVMEHHQISTRIDEYLSDPSLLDSETVNTMKKIQEFREGMTSEMKKNFHINIGNPRKKISSPDAVWNMRPSNLRNQTRPSDAIRRSRNNYNKSPDVVRKPTFKKMAVSDLNESLNLLPESDQQVVKPAVTVLQLDKPLTPALPEGIAFNSIMTDKKITDFTVFLKELVPLDELAKFVVGLLNSPNYGRILIGVEELYDKSRKQKCGRVRGIQSDRQERDIFRQKFDQIILRRIKPCVINTIINLDFIRVTGIRSRDNYDLIEIYINQTGTGIIYEVLDIGKFLWSKKSGLTELDAQTIRTMAVKNLI